MDKDKITAELQKMAEMFTHAKKERGAFVFMPTAEGFAVHKISEASGKYALAMQALSDKLEAERLKIESDEM